MKRIIPKNRQNRLKDQTDYLLQKQTEKLGGVPYQTNNNKKILTSDHSLQETTMENNEEESDRLIRKNEQKVNSIQPHKMSQQTTTELPRRGGNVTSYQNNDLETFRKTRQQTGRPLLTNKL